jgi:DNA-binding NarL/FixJ family response regulator
MAFKQTWHPSRKLVICHGYAFYITTSRNRVLKTMPIKILIVEDEAISALALKYTVEQLGCDVIGVVDTGEGAIQNAAEHRPDLILMDTRLRTSMNGVEAANAIWKQLQIRSVFISAYSAEELEKDYHGAMPFCLLVKPVLEKDLELQLKQFVNLD